MVNRQWYNKLTSRLPFAKLVVYLRVQKSRARAISINIWRKGRAALIKHGHKGSYYFIKVNCNIKYWLSNNQSIL